MSKPCHNEHARRAALCIGLTFASVVSVASAQERNGISDPPQNVQLVLDASGSMWGRVGGVSKIVVAREILTDLLRDLGENVRLGLIAYGHRRKGDCSDIEQVVSPASGNENEISRVVAEIDPKGKTPITEAVRQAAEALRYREERATVVLVTDGLETCGADPCATSAALEAEGIDFTAHVVGFDLAGQDVKGLQCIADNTGGRFLSASNANELKTALESAIETTETASLSVASVATVGDSILTSGPVYRVHARTAEGGRGEEVAFDNRARATFELPPGAYIVRARWGTAVVERAVTLEDDPVDVVIDLGVGELELSSTAREGGEILTSGTVWRVFEKAEEGDHGSELAFNNSARTSFRLSAGDYVVKAENDAASASEEVTVRPGETTERTVDLRMGWIEPEVVLESGEVVNFCNTIVSIDENGEEVEVTGDCPSRPRRYGVNEGRYFVRSYKWLDAEKRVQSEPFTLAPGETRTVRMTYTGPPLE